MWWSVGKLAAKVYGILWMTALGGFLGANLAGVIGTSFFVPENKVVHVQPWIHGGWYTGTLLALGGAIAGKLRMQSGSGFSFRKQNEDPEGRQSDEKPLEASATQENAEETSKQSSVLSAAGGLGLIGGFVGMFFGCSLLVFWFSVASSPFSPDGWASSVEVKRDRVNSSQIARPVSQTDHPVALYIVVVPAIIGLTTGVVGGGVGAAFGKVRDG
jgi:hypothetical protein